VNLSAGAFAVGCLLRFAVSLLCYDWSFLPTTDRTIDALTTIGTAEELHIDQGHYFDDA
jgi:hypothetical protein